MSNYKGANLSLKCTKTRLVAGLCPEPLGELMCSTRPLTAMDGLLRGGMEEEGAYI